MIKYATIAGWNGESHRGSRIIVQVRKGTSISPNLRKCFDLTIRLIICIQYTGKNATMKDYIVKGIIPFLGIIPDNFQLKKHMY